jgi:hypothetical protein
MAREINVKEQSEDRKLGEDLTDFLTELRTKIETDDGDRVSWKNKMVTATNQRLGVKRITNRPYPGAPNIPLPETDKLIKKSIPNLVLSAWAPKKMALVQIEDGVQVTPQMKAQAQRAELGLNMLLRKKMDLFDKLALAADFSKQYGHCVARVYEEFKYRIVHKVINLDDFPEEVIDRIKAASKDEKRAFVAQRFKLDPEDDNDADTIDDVIAQFNSGKRIIEFDIEVVSSLPNIDFPLPTKIIVPPFATDINSSPRVTLEYFLTRDELEAEMDSERFIVKDLDDMEFSDVRRSDDDVIERQKARNEGVASDSSKGELFRIHEVLCWYKPKKSEMARRWVFTFLADIADPEDSLLQDIEFPYEFEGWNYEKHDNELKDPRYYDSRGLPEQIRAVQEMMERSVNNMLIRDEMNNTPMWEVQNNSEILDGHLRFVPGQKVPVAQIGTEIKRLNEPNTVDLSSERIMQLLKATAEEYASSTDQLFRNATNVGGGKTLGEIQEGVRQSSGPVTMEVINWNNFLSKVYKKVFDILADRLEEPLFVDGIQITREDFNFPAEVKSNGTLEVSDSILASQKALARITMVGQFMQLGVSNLDDYFNAANDWLEKDGVKDPTQFTTDPKQMLQEKVVQLQQMVQQLSQQAQALQGGILEGQKQLAKTKKKGKEVVKKTEGEVEAVNE